MTAGASIEAILGAMVADVVRTEIRAGIAAGIAELRAEIASAGGTAPRKSRMTLAEARALLPGGCRQARLLEALASGALRGDQQGGRRTWVVDADDVLRWDAAGRPTSKAEVRQ